MAGCVRPWHGGGAYPFPMPDEPMPDPDSATLCRTVIHTDGSCEGALGRGGWAAVIRRTGEDGSKGEPVILTGTEPRTTNNRMEMQAAIAGLRAVPEGPVTIVSDSQYLVRGITEWAKPWKSHGWKNPAGRKVRNRDLWIELDALVGDRDIAWTWVKGHGGDAGNEEADGLARLAAKAGPKAVKPAT